MSLVIRRFNKVFNTNRNSFGRGVVVIGFSLARKTSARDGGRREDGVTSHYFRERGFDRFPNFVKFLVGKKKHNMNIIIIEGLSELVNKKIC